MKKLPIGISSLRKIIEGGYCYVDKTHFACDLIKTGVYYFLSRPRRFGKSLFVDTLKEIFQGNRELFQGLWIYDKWNWDISFPVINISLGSGVLKNRHELDRRIMDVLYQNQERFEISCRDTGDVASCFGELIRTAKKKTGNPAVVLIDEYDKPILDNITDPDTAWAMREGLKNLYSVIKDHDSYIKFVFLTGVSKFSKVSIFSGLNNLEDITINERFSSICGYTENDLTDVFREYLADKDLEQIRYWYNGYNWTGTEKVYNPFSIINYLKTGRFRNYWFESGTPTFLIELLKQKRYMLPVLEALKTSESMIGGFDIDFINVDNLLFQAGYLTVTEFRESPAGMRFTLGYPNHEVKVSLNDYIINHYITGLTDKVAKQDALYDALLNHDISEIRTILQALFASIPHDWYRKNQIDRYEGYYASVVYAFFVSTGAEVRAEDATNHGRIDMTVVMENAIYIFEFKVVDIVKDDGMNALEQVKRKGYAEKYRMGNLSVYLVGIEFDRSERNITGFQWEVTGKLHP